MQQSLFDFMKDVSRDLYELAIEIESRLYDHPATTLMKSRLYGEQLVKLVFEQEEIEEIYPLKNVERIRKLYRDEMIEKDIYIKLEWIRKKGNEAAHEMKKVKLEDVLKAHKYLYDISVWYMQVYVSYNFEPPIYDIPIRSVEKSSITSQEVDELIEPIMSQTLEEIENIRKEMSEELKSLKKVQLSEESQGEEVELAKEENKQPFPLEAYLEEKGLSYIDHREKEGALWVLGDWSISEKLFALKKYKIYFRYRKQGGRASKHKPAWYLLNKTIPLVYIDEAKVTEASLKSSVKEKTIRKKPIEVVDITADYWLEKGQLHLPLHLLEHAVNEAGLKGLKYVYESLEIHYFKDLTEDTLRKVYQQSRKHFFHLMNELYVLGFRFTGNLATFQVAPTKAQEQKINLRFVDEKLELNKILPPPLVNQLKEYQIDKVIDFNKMLLSSLGWVLKKTEEEIAQLLTSSIERFVEKDTKEQENNQVKVRNDLVEAPLQKKEEKTGGITTSIQEHVEQDEEEMACVSEKQEREESDLTLGFKGQEVRIAPSLLELPVKELGIKGCNHFINRLMKQNMPTLYDLPKVLDNLHKELRGVGPKTVEKFWEQLIEINEAPPTKAEEPQRDVLYYDGETISLPENLIDEPLQPEDFPGSNQAMMTLLENGIETYGDLAASFSEIGKFKGIGNVRIQSIFTSVQSMAKQKAEALKLEKMPAEERFEYEINRFKKWFDELTNNDQTKKKPEVSDRYVRFIQKRYEASLRNEHVTLEQLAQTEGITRERVRQILKREDEWVVEEWRVLAEFLRNKLEKERIILISSIFNGIDEALYLLFHALETIGIYKHNLEDKRVMTTLDEKALTTYKAKIEEEVEAIFDLQVISKERLFIYCKERAEGDQVSEQIILTIAEQVIDWINEEQGVLKKMTKADVVEMVMLQYPHGAKVYDEEQELIKKANAIMPGGFSGDRSFNSFLSRDDVQEKFILWGRGMYIHEKFVTVDGDTLDEMEQIVAQWLQDEPFIHVRKVYEEMLKASAKKTIPNEYALYALMRNNNKGLLSFPRFPTILLEGKERLENEEWIVQYIREQNRPVTLQELIKEFVDGKGWQRFTLEHNLSYSATIISYRYGYYTLLENYDAIQEEDLAPVLHKISAEFRKSTVVNTRVLFKENDMYLKSKGIDTAHVLYALIRKYLAEEVHFPRYPYIVAEEFAGDSLAAQHIVEEYIREEERIVAREEAIHWLDETFGMESIVLDNALVVSSNIYYYSVGQFGEYVHRDTLGLDEVAITEINKQMNEQYEHIKANRKRPYVFLKELFEVDRLPELANYIPWNEQLLGDVLKKSRQWVLIGSYGEILLPQHRELSNEIDFIHYILQHNYKGAVKLNKLRNYLKEIRYSSEGMLLHIVDQAIERDEAPFVLLGDELIERTLMKE